MKNSFEFPFEGRRGRNENSLRGALVNLLNIGVAHSDAVKFTFFVTNATNFHSDGAIVAYDPTLPAPTRRTGKNVLQVWPFGASMPSTVIGGCTQFDRAYIRARQYAYDLTGA